MSLCSRKCPARAAVVIGSGTQRISSAVSGVPASPTGYLTAAGVATVVATLLLVAVAQTGTPTPAPERPPAEAEAPVRLVPWRNVAFVTLHLAMVASVLAVTMITKSTLFYLKYPLGDEGGGARRWR